MMEEVISLDIFTAASIGQAEVISSMVKDVNAKNQSLWTPLMYASYYGHEKLVGSLLVNGADPNLRNGSGRSSMILAAMCGNDNVVGALLKRDGENQMRIRDARGWSALFYAAYLGHQNVVRVLLHNGDDPNVRDAEHGFTPLMIACDEGHEIVVQCLLKYGSDPHAYSNADDTARSLAHYRGNFKIVALLDGHVCKQMTDEKLDVQHGPEAVARLIDNRLPFTSKKNDGLLVFLDGLGLGKYHEAFVKQDVDLEVFLSLNDGDLKEIGIPLLGPRRKMTSAIARWHAQAPLPSTIEGAYANKLEAELQEMSSQLHRAVLGIKKLQTQVEREKRWLAEDKAFVTNVCTLCRDALEVTKDTEIHKLENRSETNRKRNHVEKVFGIVEEIHVAAKNRLENLDRRNDISSCS